MWGGGLNQAYSVKRARVDTSSLPLEPEPRFRRGALTCSPIGEGFGKWTWEGLRKINTVDFLHLFAEPDIKRLLRHPHSLKDSLNILRLDVKDGHIPLWGMLEIRGLPGLPQTLAGCCELAVARPCHLLVKVFPLLGLPR
jgi:hypothetical protein